MKRNFEEQNKEIVYAVKFPYIYGTSRPDVCQWNVDHTRTDERRLKAAEMLFLRHVSGYTLWVKETSDETRSHLGIRKLDKHIHERENNWLEYLQRTPSEGDSKQIILSTAKKMWSRKTKKKMAKWLDVWGWKRLISWSITDDDVEYMCV
jgi:hypothetical protein